MTIKSVCVNCNSQIGSNIDGPFINSFYVSLQRSAFDIKGKSGGVPKPFGGVGLTTEGCKVRLDDDLTPIVLPSVEETNTADGGILLKMVFDKSDESCLSKEGLKKVSRTLKKMYPDMADVEIKSKAESILEKAYKQMIESTSSATCKYQFTIDIAVMRLEYIKIAYEIAFYLFGYDYVEQSSTALTLRQAVNEHQTEPLVQVTLSPDRMNELFPESDNHIVVVLNGNAYVRLFGLPALVLFEESDARFMCPVDKARVFSFNFKDRTYTEESFALG